MAVLATCGGSEIHIWRISIENNAASNNSFNQSAEEMAFMILPCDEGRMLLAHAPFIPALVRF